MKHCGCVQMHSTLIASGPTILGGRCSICRCFSFHPTSQAFPMVRADAASNLDLRGSTPSRDGTWNNSKLYGNARGFSQLLKVCPLFALHVLLHPANHFDLTRCSGMRRSKLHNSPLGKRRKTSRWWLFVMDSVK